MEQTMIADIAQHREELRDLCRRFDRKAIEASRNYIRKRHILAGAEPIYAA
jgi:hypothetical protein